MAYNFNSRVNYATILLFNLQIRMKALSQQEINAKLNIPENGCLKLIKCSVGTTETWNRHFNRGTYNTDSITEIVPIY